MNCTSTHRSFRISAPSMVFGPDVVENIRHLADIVDNIEIVLFHTPDLHNLPEHHELCKIKRLAKQKKVTYTVHLPTTLELASEIPEKRRQSVQLATEICDQMGLLNPVHYIVHIPFTRPTLVPVPGQYFKSTDLRIGAEWTRRALESVEKLRSAIPEAAKLLVENINYAPSFLDVFLKSELCDLCLDLGHLLLGRENVLDHLQQYLNVTREIHLHGVKGYADHFSVALLPGDLVHECLRCLVDRRFSGLLNLEVFNPRDLSTSLECIRQALQAS